MAAQGDPQPPTGMLTELTRLEKRVRAMVELRRSDDPAPDDPFRGLYLSDAVVDHLLEAGPDDGTEPPAPSRPRLAALAERAGLTELDVALLLVALAPDVDRRFESLYAYLNDDVSRRRATVGLALELAEVPVASAAARARLHPGAPLIDRRLLLVEDLDRPVLSRALRVPDRVGAHLLGDDTPDGVLGDIVVSAVPHRTPTADDLGRALRDGVRLVYLRDRGRRTAVATAVAASRLAGLGSLVVDLRRLRAAAGAGELIAVLGREALLRSATVVASSLDDLREEVGLLRELSASAGQVLLCGDATWDPHWARHVPLQVDAPQLTTGERERVWKAALGEPSDLTDAWDLADAPVHLPLGPDQIVRAVEAARLSASIEARGVDGSLLRTGARQQNAAGLERLARRIEPGVGWDDLVLPPPVATALHELAARARHRDRVLVDWRMRPGGGRGRGVTALFAGDSGTGKTMSAEVIAGELGLDLYTVDLATVVDKYVGETEKNLERIFAEAGGVNGVLLFDEADAIFGKRSEVRDAHDRYANIESAYLLQRMETFDGLAILTTNLRANIDEAFTRRLDAVIDFPTPDTEMRLALWEACLGPQVPRAENLDLSFCASAFELSGGAIRSVAVTAAYLAAERGTPVGMPELIGAVHREYRKLGRLLLRQEFGPYYDLVR